MQQKIKINDMLSVFGNVFYPTEHVMVLLKDAGELHELEDEVKLIRSTDYYLFTPDEIISTMAPIVKEKELITLSPIPEVKSIITYVNLACEGYSAILVEINEGNKDFVMQAIEQFDNYVAKYYGLLQVEDISPPDLEDAFITVNK